jgi:chloride channel 3/4/5
LTAIISYPIIFTRAGSGELINNLFQECAEVESEFAVLCSNSSFVVWALIYTIVTKSIFTIFTFGTRVPAGIFVPSMVIGASVGRIIGIFLENLYQNYPNYWLFSMCNGDKKCVTPGHFAIVGAAAFLGGVTRMTVSLVVIMFELTGAVPYILPIMITIVIAKWSGEQIQSHSIYDALIALNRFPFLDAESKSRNGHASDVMTSIDDLVCIRSETTVSVVREIIASEDFKGFPVITNNGQSIGYCLKPSLEAFLNTIPVETDCNIYFDTNEEKYGFIGDDGDVSSLLDAKPMSISPKMPLEICVELFKKMGLRYVLVTQNGLLKGIITKKDLLRLAI